MVCAFALHLAFPLTGWWWLAPWASAGLLASWCALRVRTAAWVGFASGMVFFGFGFSWFAESAGALVGAAAPLLILGPAALESLAFAAVAAVCAYAAQRCDVRAVPFVAAAAYALAEQIRSQGVMGAPLSQIGVAMIDSPLRALAAFFGSYGITFATVLLGSSLGWWLLARTDMRRAYVTLGCWLGVIIVAAGAWAVWPARHLAPPARVVAAVQGGIAQSIKRSDGGIPLAIARYTSLTAALRAAHPQIILWPETVITEDYANDAALDARFARLASDTGARLYVGTLVATQHGAFNALRVYGRGTRALYFKEQLVPFAEYLPGPDWLRALPLADQIGAYAPGINNVETIDGATPLICWESDFPDIAHARLADDPSLFLVSTDDAWFGTTQGPYEQAAASTMRAVETGRWVLRAAATGISGIVAPDGRWTQRTTISNIPTTVLGSVGAPAPALYARIGPAPVGLALALIVFVPFIVPLLRRRGRA